MNASAVVVFDRALSTWLPPADGRVDQSGREAAIFGYFGLWFELRSSHYIAVSRTIRLTHVSELMENLHDMNPTSLRNSGNQHIGTV